MSGCLNLPATLIALCVSSPLFAHAAVADTTLSFAQVFSGSSSSLGRVTNSKVLTPGVTFNYDLRVNDSGGIPYRYASAWQTLSASFDDQLAAPGPTVVSLSSSATTGRIVYQEGKELHTSLKVGQATFPMPSIDMGIYIDRTQSLAHPADSTRPGRVSDTEGYAGLRNTEIGIPLVLTASATPAFVATYAVDFGSTSSALGYARRGDGSGALAGLLSFDTNGSTRYRFDVDLAEPGIYDFFLLKNVSGIAAIETIQRSLGVRVSYFVVLGPSGEKDVPVIPTGAPILDTGVLQPADNAAYSRFFSIDVAAPVPEPQSAALWAVGLMLLGLAFRLRRR